MSKVLVTELQVNNSLWTGQKSIKTNSVCIETLYDRTTVRQNSKSSQSYVDQPFLLCIFYMLNGLEV